MTARPFWDPVTGAAIAHLGLRILPGLPCPTCRGTGWRCRNSNLMCTHRVHQGCEDCTGSGVWTPPDHPVTIGVTSATADAMLDQDERMHEAGYDIGIIGDQRSGWELATRPPGEEWTSGNTIKHPIVLSSMIGEGTLRKVKVVEADADGHGAVVEMRPDGSLWFWPEGAFGEDAATDISSALPFLPGLKPGDTVYLLDGFTQSVECDGGRCGLSHRGCYPGDTSWCSSCDQMIPTERNGRFVTHWHRPMRRSCPFPVDAPDHPCVQP